MLFNGSQLIAIKSLAWLAMLMAIYTKPEMPLMRLKSDDQINELVRYIRWYDSMKSDNHARNWLNKNIPNWMECHDTKITYSDRIGTE